MMRLKLGILLRLSLVTVGVLIHTVKAENFSVQLGDPPYYTTDWFPKPWSPQFQSWYPNYNPLLTLASEGTCNETLHDYQVAFNAPSGSFESSQLLAICYRHEACVFDSIGANNQLNLQAAGIVLGLLPTLMSTIGISIGETALLSTHRPVLSLLLSLAAPAIWPTRVFEYKDPAELLAAGPGNFELKPLRSWKAGLLSLFEYVFALGGVINIFLLSWDMGNKTILAWGCTTVIGPLLWTSLAAVLHAISALSYNMVVWKSQDRRGLRPGGKTLWRRLRSALSIEITTCANQKVPTQLIHEAKDDISATSIALNILAGGVSFIHLTFGTIVFSSLLFITVWDVLNRILWRFLLSTLAARLILIIELAGFRASVTMRRDADVVAQDGLDLELQNVGVTSTMPSELGRLISSRAEP